MDIKNIKQFGPSRLGVGQDRCLWVYQSDNDKFETIVPPIKDGNLLTYDINAKAYKWEDVEYIYVNTATINPDDPDPTDPTDPIDPIDPPDTDPDPEPAQSIMLRVHDTSIYHSADGSVISGDLWIAFYYASDLSIKNSLGNTVNRSRYAAFEMKFDTANFIDFTISGITDSVTKLDLDFFIKVGEDKIKIVDANYELYIPNSYQSITFLKLEGQLTKFTIGSQAVFGVLEYLQIGDLEMTTETYEVPFPIVFPDLSIANSLAGLNILLNTTTDETEDILEKLANGLPVYTGVPSGPGYGLITLNRPETVNTNSVSHIATIESKNYITNIIP